MDEERARDIAIRIRDEIEDLLDEKDIMIPSLDREGVPGEARLYGEENSRLEEAIVGVLLEQADVTMTDQDAGDASHPLRQLVIRILDEFEELLAEKNVMIPSEDREGRQEEACLYGAEYYTLEDAVVGILMEETAEKDEQAIAQVVGIDADARKACDAMRRRMAATPEGLVAGRSGKSERSDVWTPSRAETGHRGQGR